MICITLCTVHDRDCLDIFQCFCNLISREWTEQTNLNQSDFLSLLAKSVHCIFCCSCCGTNDNNCTFSIFHTILLEKSVFSAGKLLKILSHFFYDTADISCSLCLITLCFHIIICDRVRADCHRALWIQKIIFRLILTNKILDVCIFQKFNILYGVACDESILTDHDWKAYIFMLGNAESLNHVVISFLIILCVNLDPACISCSHTVRMITVDIDRTGQCSVYKCKCKRKSVRSCNVKFLPHISKSTGRSCCKASCSCSRCSDCC